MDQPSKKLPPDELPEHYIEAQTSLVERPLRTLKDGDAFLITDHYGDCSSDNESPQGLYFRDTRYLSRLELRFSGARPLFLGSTVHSDNAVLSVDLTNPDTQLVGGDNIPRDLIAIERTKFLWRGVCYERIGFRNFDSRTRICMVQMLFGSDFHDLFEVRGSKRAAHGTLDVVLELPSAVAFRYHGLDDVERHTNIAFQPTPLRLEHDAAHFRLSLEPGQRTSILATIACSEGHRVDPPDFRIALRDSRRRIRFERSKSVGIQSSNELFDAVMARAQSDLIMLLTQTTSGPYPYAGIPWFSTPFGRDGVITAMLLLWTNPSVALGVLRFLAAHQARDFNASADAQPGKILHEMRNGEMANLGEVPFGRYYGSVDSTPLFVLLAGLYFERTGDLASLADLWPNILAALEWCDTHGDPDGDGFIEYFRQTPQGLANQGWKDSNDAIFHADGTLAEGPIALVEVQAYLFAARRAIAVVARALGEQSRSDQLEKQAEDLRIRFEEKFWCPKLSTYALALDGSKAQCAVRSSNAGHALLCGIASAERAALTVNTLMSLNSFSGWGIRTIAQGEARYNPMSYHDGSIWPHDNALCAIGMARYGFKAEATRVFAALHEAAMYQDHWRMPELYCGFIRRNLRGPTSYPVACSPQAWAAASTLGALGAILGLHFDHEHNEIRFVDPHLPAFLEEITLRGLSLGAMSTDVHVTRGESEYSISVSRKSGDGKVLFEPKG